MQKEKTKFLKFFFSEVSYPIEKSNLQSSTFVLGLATNYYGDLVENPPYSDALPYTILGYA